MDSGFENTNPTLIETDCVVSLSKTTDIHFNLIEPSRIRYLMSSSYDIYYKDDAISQLAEKLFSIGEDSFLAVSIYPTVSNIWQKIREDDSDLTSPKVGGLGGLSYISIYPSKEYRIKNFLKLEDSFYESIPGIESKIIKNGILSRIYNIEDDLETQVRAVKKVADYYRDKKKQLGIWDKVLLWPGWRETYKDILVEKGLI